jgi:hypothetical protein
MQSGSHKSSLNAKLARAARGLPLVRRQWWQYLLAE